jgi:hypothetical protein
MARYLPGTVAPIHMPSRRESATIAAIMKATDWRQTLSPRLFSAFH